MKPKKESLNWPDAYEAPKVFHIDTAFQQALGITYCSIGTSASGAPGACANGIDASGGGQTHGCADGASASGGPSGGQGKEACGGGLIAMQ